MHETANNKVSLQGIWVQCSFVGLLQEARLEWVHLRNCRLHKLPTNADQLDESSHGYRRSVATFFGRCATLSTLRAAPCSMPHCAAKS